MLVSGVATHGREIGLSRSRVVIDDRPDWPDPAAAGWQINPIDIFGCVQPSQAPVMMCRVKGHLQEAHLLPAGLCRVLLSNKIMHQQGPLHDILLCALLCVENSNRRK